MNPPTHLSIFHLSDQQAHIIYVKGKNKNLFDDQVSEKHRFFLFYRFVSETKETTEVLIMRRRNENDKKQESSSVKLNPFGSIFHFRVVFLFSYIFLRRLAFLACFKPCAISLFCLCCPWNLTNRIARKWSEVKDNEKCCIYLENFEEKKFRKCEELDGFRCLLSFKVNKNSSKMKMIRNFSSFLAPRFSFVTQYQIKFFNAPL